MHRMLFSLLVVMAVLVPSAEAAGQNRWLVGFAEADMTPGVRQCQMSGFGRERYAKGAIAPLVTQALALRDAGGRTAVLITADVTGFDWVTVEAIRHAIERKHGISRDNVLIAASHTHWGPAAKLNGHFSCGAPNVWYLAKLEGWILDNVSAALKALRPASIEYAHVDFRGIGCSRRLIVKGRVKWAPNPNGAFDGHTPILRIQRDDSPKQLLVVGHACHPTSSGMIEKWSPDYPGAMRAEIEARLPSTKALFVQGCGGDAKIVHKDPKTGKLVFSADPERARQAGQKLAGSVMARIEKGDMLPLVPKLACGLATGQLSFDKQWSMDEIRKAAFEGSRKSWMTWNARQFLANPDESKSYRYNVQAWRLGDLLTILGLEGEVCAAWGPILRSMASTPQAMVIGYANQTTVYIPTNQMMREGGYEAATSHKYFKPGPFTENIESEVKAIVAQALNAVR